jgi:bacterioferritin
MTDFTTDLETIRKRARDKMSDGPITGAYTADVSKVVNVLNEALATELVCVLRYKSHYYNAKGIHAESVKAEFLEHANEEQLHADQIAERIGQLGGEPDLNPATLTQRSHSQYVAPESLEAMIREDLVAERIAIETYMAIIRWLGDHDVTTRRLMEEILAKEEEHARDLSDLLAKIGAK